MGKITLRAFTVCLTCVLLIVTGTASFASAKESAVTVYIEGKLLHYEGQQPLIQKGTTLVPFRATFEALGYAVEWDAAAQRAIGKKPGTEIELTIGSLTAKVNGRTAKLSVPAQAVRSSTMIPLRFVSENSGYDVAYSQSAGRTVIRIGSGGPVGSTAGGVSDQPEPYVVKGIVVNPQGQPIKGALITIDNQLLYNSNSQAVTDAQGRYRIELSTLAATYMAYAEYSTVYGGVEHSIDLLPDNDNPFAGSEGAVRNFTVKLDSSTGTGGSGEVLFYMMDLIHPLDPVLEPPNRDDVTLTLEPVGAMLDGTVGGDKIVSKGSNSNNGYGVHNVPIGKYKVSAVYAPPGAEPQQMLIRVLSRGQDNAFAESVVAEFGSITSKIHRMELELKLDVVKPPAAEEEWDWDAVYDLDGNRIN